MKPTLILILAVFLAVGCAKMQAPPPVISDISESHVKVVGFNAQQVEQEARRGCALYDRYPEPLSYLCLIRLGNCVKWEQLFACVEKGRGDVKGGVEEP